MVKKRKAGHARKPKPDEEEQDMIDADDDGTAHELELGDTAEPQAAVPLEHAATIRAISAAFSGNLPPAAVSGGSYDMAQARDIAEDHASEAAMLPIPQVPPATGVPDGRYRVAGHDWIVTIAGELAVLFERGGPQTDPASYTEVPTS
jgi:hypothetical protein